MRRTLLPYQARWVADKAGVKVIEKSRRIGLSWAEAYDAVMHAGEGGGNIYYQSYNRDMTRGFIDDCAEWARTINVGAEAVGEILIRDGDRDVQAFRLGLASGKEVLAMTSAPRAFRSKGRPGDVAVIDEAAFVDDLDEALKAALAFRQWGGRVHILSTHNGEASPFAALVRGIGDDVRPGSLHTIALKQALEQGLYKRICAVTGQDWSPPAEAAWEAQLRAEYGIHAAEELDCIPSAGGGAWLAWELIRAAEDAGAGAPDDYAGGPVHIGIDIGRRHDLWVAAVIETVGDVLWLRELVVRHNITFAEQAAIVAALDHRYRPLRIAVDQTGMGEAVVERWQGAHGRLRVEGVLMTAPRKLDVATALREAMEDRRLRIPADDALRRDLHSIRAEAGPTGAARLVAERGATDGHADRFWALALPCAAAADDSGPFTARTTNHRYAGLTAYGGGGGDAHAIDRRLTSSTAAPTGAVGTDGPQPQTQNPGTAAAGRGRCHR